MAGHQVGVSQRVVLGDFVQLTFQGSYVVEIRQKIKSWSARHEGKWRHVPTKLEEKIPVHCEVKTRIMHTQRLMYVVGGEIGSKGFIFKIIECQQKKKGNNNGIREDGGVCSPISMTRSNQFLEEGGFYK